MQLQINLRKESMSPNRMQKLDILQLKTAVVDNNALTTVP